MKKIYNFSFDAEGYKIKLDDVEKLNIPRDSLVFDGDELYRNIFKDFAGEEIEIENKMSDEEMKSDIFAQPILDIIKEIIESVIDKIKFLIFLN